MLAPPISLLREAIERKLEVVVKSSGEGGQLHEAFHYSIFPGGKRIRPVLALALCNDLGGDWLSLVAAALSLEIVHNSSLIHDDLPALDNDDMRRGRPSCHKAYGQGTALLAGDYMISFAFRNLISAGLSSEQTVELSNSLAFSFEELCVGQQLDILTGKARGELLRIHELKTGALFGSCAEFAAIASPYFFTELRGKSRTLAREFGRKFGICFQICNDYHDAFGNQSETGRKVSSDIKNGKETCFSGGGALQAKSMATLQNELQHNLSELEKLFPEEKNGAESLTRQVIQQVLSDFSKIISLL